MLNFNNKKDKQILSLLSHEQEDRAWCEQSFHRQQHKKEQNATQCLLLLSQLEQRDRPRQQQVNKQKFPEIQVTPWTNTPCKIKFSCLKKASKSKTSILLPVQDEEFPSYQNQSNEKNFSELRQNRIFTSKKESKRKMRVTTKNQKQIQNSYSAISRYAESNNQPFNYPSENFYEVKENKDQRIFIRSKNNLTKGSSTSHERHKRNIPKTNKQNYPFQLFSRNESRTAKKNRNGQQNQVNSITDQIFRHNMHCNNFVSNPQKQAINTEQSQLTEIMNRQQRADPKLETEYLVFSSGKLKNSKDNINPYRFQFQNILANITKSSSQYQKIKYRIMQNIKKQSVLQPNMSSNMSIEKSKKLIGRYFKQFQDKKSRGKMHAKISANCSLANSKQVSNNRSQVLDTSGYQLANPLGKNLYEKYKILLSKGK